MSSPLSAEIFREYDIRGIVGTELDAQTARRIAVAYAVKLARSGARPGDKPVALGRDCRLSSESLFAAFSAGLRESGYSVIDLGVCPTPVVYFALYHLDVAGGVQITGSHNPAEYNGFKLSCGRTTIWGEEIQELYRIVKDGETTGAHAPGSIEPYAIVAAYQDYVRQNTPLEGKGMKIVVDGGNGTGGAVGAPLFESMGFHVEGLFCEMDGRFPNHHPDPTVAKNLEALIARVRETQAAIGIAYDGDADRLGAVDENGKIFWGDQLLIVFARDILSRNPGAAIVGEVKCSELLYKDIEARGGRAIMWKTGHSILKAKLKEEDALLAGEMSGHLFFKERYFGYDDAIYASVRLVDILKRSQGKASQLLADLPETFTTPEIRVDCADSLKFKVADKARERFARDHRVIAIDGVRVLFEPDGWGLIRASNTQPVLVLRFEASTPERLAEIRGRVEAELGRIRAELGA
ncbi:MAG: phosphomannomutase/phosphoglucomutase [Acidobacteriota bacterium]